MKEKLFTVTTILIFLSFVYPDALAGIHRQDVAAEKFIALAKEPQFDCGCQLKRGEKEIGSAVLISSRWALSSYF